MRRNNLWLAIVVASCSPLMAGCPSIPAVDAAGEPITLDVVGDAVHEPTGLVFPPTLDGTPRDEVTLYDAGGSNMSAGYNDVLSGLVWTIYLYPVPDSVGVDTAFEHAADDVRRAYGDAELLAFDRLRAKPPATGEARVATWTADRPATGVGPPVATHLAVAEVPASDASTKQRYVVKLRATFPMASRDAAWRRTGELFGAWQAANTGK